MRQAPHCPLATHVNSLPTSEKAKQGVERKDEYPWPAEGVGGGKRLAQGYTKRQKQRWDVALALQCLSPTSYPYSHPCVHSVWDLVVWTCSTSKVTSFIHDLLFAFASGWGMTGFCLIWGNRKKKRQGDLSLLWLPKQEKLRIFQAVWAAGVCKPMRSQLKRTGVQLPLLLFQQLPPVPPPGSTPAELKPWQNPSVGAPSLPPPQLQPEQPLSFIFHTRSSQMETLVKNLAEAARDTYFFLSVVEGRGVTAGRVGGRVCGAGFFFPFRNTSCSGECLVLLTLSGSGNYCGLRSLVIRCYCRRHGSAEPELFMQPSWSSQASRLGRAANGAVGLHGGAESNPGPWGHPPSPVVGCPRVRDSPACGGWLQSHPKWPEEGLGGVRRAGGRRAPVMRECGIPCALCERAEVCVPAWQAVPALHIAI